jgi:hypothetical protein
MVSKDGMLPESRQAVGQSVFAQSAAPLENAKTRNFSTNCTTASILATLACPANERV